MPRRQRLRQPAATAANSQNRIESEVWWSVGTLESENPPQGRVALDSSLRSFVDAHFGCDTAVLFAVPGEMPGLGCLPESSASIITGVLFIRF